MFYTIYNNVSITHQHSHPLNHEGVWFCTKLLYNGLMNILQKIFKEHYEEIIYILHPRKSIIETEGTCHELSRIIPWR